MPRLLGQRRLRWELRHCVVFKSLETAFGRRLLSDVGLALFRDATKQPHEIFFSSLSSQSLFSHRFRNTRLPDCGTKVWQVQPANHRHVRRGAWHDAPRDLLCLRDLQHSVWQRRVLLQGMWAWNWCSELVLHVPPPMVLIVCLTPNLHFLKKYIYIFTLFPSPLFGGGRSTTGRCIARNTLWR